MTTDGPSIARAAAGSLARTLREQQRLGGGHVDADALTRIEAATAQLEATLAGAPAAATPSRPAEAPQRAAAPQHRAPQGAETPQRAEARQHGAESPQRAEAPKRAETPQRTQAPHRAEAPQPARAPEASATASPPPASAPPASSGAKPASAEAAATPDAAPQRPAVDTTPMLDLPWVPRDTAATKPAAPDAPEAVLAGVERPSLDAIRDVLGPCERCGLCSTRTNIVFGVGNPNARLMFIGEAPGRDEDAQGEPFVGRAGELLTKMIGAMGYSRDDVYIANIIKCRPPDNRDPSPDEIRACEPFVLRQIDSVQPEVIVTLGRIALQAMTKKKLSIMRTRGSWIEVRGVPTMPTLHPAFLLRKPEFKREAWSDLQQVMGRLGLEGRR